MRTSLLLLLLSLFTSSVVVVLAKPSGALGGLIDTSAPLALEPSEEIPLSCPHEGVFGYPHPKACDEYFQCTNGTLTHEYCPNGLLFTAETGHVVGFCAYYWNVACPKDKIAPKPISSPGCPYQFGFFAEEHGEPCNVFYSECSWGVPSRRQCEPAGLFYDERIKGCNWPDQLGCSSENLLNFKCPEEDKGNRYWPYPRYYYNEASIITCVTGQPRLIHCQAGEELVDPNSLTCQSIHPKEDSKPEPVVVQPLQKNRRFKQW